MYFEESAVPYLPILRRRIWRRRLLITALVLLVVVPYAIIRYRLASETVGARLVDQIGSIVAMRYFDPNYHGVRWKALVAQYRPRVAAARTQSERYALLAKLVGTLADSHTAVYSPSDLTHVVSKRGTVVTRAAASNRDDESLVSWRALSYGVGYVRLGAFPDAIAPVLQWVMEEGGRFPALVLDLRGNPGGLVDSVDATAGVFLPPGTLVSSGLRRFHPFGVQRFRATPDAGVTYSGKLVVIVDGTTQSGAESLARALQYYHRAIIVGTRTAGKVLGVDVEVPLEDGGLLRVATLDMFAPDGKRLEGAGVTPDVIAISSPRDSAARHDRALSAALRTLAPH
jgi:hypothetical protein